MSGHTPGPWEYIDGSKTASMQFGPVCVIRGSGKQIASFSWQSPSVNFPSKDESQANARLIAAAPELLEALERILEVRVNGWDNIWAGSNRCQDIARTALSKAKEIPDGL